MGEENARRREAARDAWLGQLTPEQRADVLARGQREVDHPGEVIEAGPEVLAAVSGLVGWFRGPGDLAARSKEVVRGRVDPDEGYGLLWAPDEPRESLQRAFDRRD